MKAGLIQRVLWLAATAGLLSALFWLDQHRGGPATMLSRCNLALSRSGAPAADVLIIGSSRSGVALDPIAMQEMLAHASARDAPTVDRLALGRSPLRASLALLENYLEARGAPRVIALEIMFMTQRSIDRLADSGIVLPPERYVFRRDLNLMSFAQILRTPAVAMPFSEDEGTLNLWRFRVRGVLLRAGALLYQFLRQPTGDWGTGACDKDALTREPSWPGDFAFSYGDVSSGAPPKEMIEMLEAAMTDVAGKRTPKEWQSGLSLGQRYPYDFQADYRQGEVALLESMLELAARHRVPVVLLPLPLYGYTLGAEDLRWLAGTVRAPSHVFDVYGQVQGDLASFWYDDGHIERYPAGALTTAILAEHLLETGLTAEGAGRIDD